MFKLTSKIIDLPCWGWLKHMITPKGLTQKYYLKGTFEVKWSYLDIFLPSVTFYHLISPYNSLPINWIINRIEFCVNQYNDKWQFIHSDRFCFFLPVGAISLFFVTWPDFHKSFNKHGKHGNCSPCNWSMLTFNLYKIPEIIVYYVIQL